MPPKRTASMASKRKASESPEPDYDASQSQSQSQFQSQSQSQRKRTKVKHIPLQPTNKVLPATIAFPSRKEGCIRIAAWNITSYASAYKKGLKHYVEAEDPDILVLTETKVPQPPVDAVLSHFPHQYWAIASKKGYSGTAILSKHAPISVTQTIPGHPDQANIKGRIITLEFAGCYVIGTYVTNAGAGLKNMNKKQEWNLHFTRYIRELDKRKPVIWTGDLNVAPTEMDIFHAKTNWNKSAGYTEIETTAFKEILKETSGDASSSSITLPDPLPDIPVPTVASTIAHVVENLVTGSTTEEASSSTNPQFIDVWRYIHPQDRHYSYFAFRFNCREKGIGWRIDMFVLSHRILERVKMCEIRDEIYGASDHCPIVLEIEGAL